MDLLTIPKSYLASGRVPIWVFLFLFLTGIGSASPNPTTAPFSLNLGGLGGNSSVAGTTLASGLSYPYGIALAPDGSLLVGESVPQTSSGIEGGPSVGSVWKIPMQGGFFGTPQQVISGLNGPVTEVRCTPNGLILVDSGAASGRQMTFYNQSFQQIGVVNFSYPQSWEHSVGMGLEAQQADGSVRVYFIVGSQTDQTKTTVQVTTSGLFSATLNADSIYMVTLEFNGNSVQASGSAQQVATGLRNPFGLALDSAGNLIIGDNGQDGTHVVNEFGADALYVIPAANIGTVLYDLGFPNSYVDFATGQYVDGDTNATPPLTAFLPVADTNGALQYSEGLSAMAFIAPNSVPFAGALGGVIATFHGVKNASGAANYDNAVEYYDFASGRYTPIVDSGTAGVGHLDSVLILGNSIILADFVSNGVVDHTGGDEAGAIYEFTISASGVSPAPGATLPETSAAFSWTPTSGATAYQVMVGSQAGLGDYFTGATNSTSINVTGLPCDGRPVYVSVAATVGGVLRAPNQYTYTASSGCAALLSPANGSTLTFSTATFTWSLSAGADQYQLSLGSGVGAADIFTSSTVETSGTVNNIPCDGRTIYVQLSTHLNGAFQNPGRYQYTAASNCSSSTGVSPASGSTAHEVFTYTFTNSGGWQNLGVMNVLINSAIDGIQACYVAYVPSSATSGSLFLVDDAGDAGGPYSGLVLPGNGSVQNSQCSISGTGSSVAASGNTLTLTLNVTFNAAFAGNKTIYMAAQGNGPGWQGMGTWDVPGGAVPAGPAVPGMSPARSTTASQTYTFTFADSNGWPDIGVTDILVNGSLDGRHACYMAFVPSGANAGSLLLVDDAGDAEGPYSGLVLPGSGTVQNSQCTLNAAGSSVTGSGNTLTLTLALSFAPAFAGNQIFFVAARNNTLNSNWQSVGSVSVP